MPNEEWIGPFAGADRRWTTLGNISSIAHAAVDERGLVGPRRAGWSVDWWIGAEDRWHVPSREHGVRQRLVDNTPVVETVLRVPGGDVVHRSYAVAGDRELAVIEVENQTPTPVALAWAVRPYGPEGSRAISEIRLDDATVSVDGRPALFLPRRPARVASGTADGDSAQRVLTGADAPGSDFDVRCGLGRAQAAFVYPLAHGAVLRAAVALRTDGRTPAPGSPEGLPSAVQVARGWATHTRKGMRVDLPSGALADAIEANRRFLLLLQARRGDRSTEAALRRARRAYGFHREADELPPRRWSFRQRVDAPPADPADALTAVLRLLATASATWTWADGHDAATAAAFLLLARELLVHEGDRELALLPAIPDAWRGQPLEVHDAPTRHGILSFAVRWHGERPALLWDLQGSRAAVRLTVPGLDRDWVTTEPRGDALLAPAAVG